MMSLTMIHDEFDYDGDGCDYGDDAGEMII